MTEEKILYKYYVVLANNSWGGGRYLSEALNQYLKQVDTDQDNFNYDIVIMVVKHDKTRLSKANVGISGMGSLTYPMGGSHESLTHTLDRKLLTRWTNLYWRTERAKEALSDTVYNSVFP